MLKKNIKDPIFVINYSAEMGSDFVRNFLRKCTRDLTGGEFTGLVKLKQDRKFPFKISRVICIYTCGGRCHSYSPTFEPFLTERTRTGVENVTGAPLSGTYVRD